MKKNLTLHFCHIEMHLTVCTDFELGCGEVNCVPNLYDFHSFVKHKSRYFEPFWLGNTWLQMYGRKTKDTQMIFFYVPQKESHSGLEW